MKTYKEIDLNESPIVVLGCGHFFTAETLDGHMGMAEVYEQDVNGVFTGLQDTSISLARSVPRCPDCQCLVRQYCTQRFNKVINRAVIDEMSKRFLVHGKDQLRVIEQTIAGLEREFQNSQDEILAAIRLGTGHATTTTVDIDQKLKERFTKSKEVQDAIHRFQSKVTDRNQPAQKLHDATVNAVRRRPIDQMMTDLTIHSSVPMVSRDRRVTFGGRISQLQAECIILTDRFDIAKVLKSTITGASIKISGGAPAHLAKSFFRLCHAFIKDCDEENLPKLAVQATLYYARMARSNESYCCSTKTEIDQASRYVQTAKELLGKAKILCTQGFQDADKLSTAVDETMKMIIKEWYEEVTAKELAAIREAMVSGSRGLATHSGHWYNCANGHPVGLARTVREN